ncbi:MAG: precorrin-2 C(20)-methyltransferase [Firmicutes bacterium]|nr:precorrin-2 C(20)-methyltransferase [Bacillota bacterium]
MKKGMIYCIGVGPGDPELLTLKAVQLIREADVIAVPGKEPKESVAYRIAAGAVPEIMDKTLAAVPMPMTKDSAVLEKAHREGAKQLEKYVDEGITVVYLTLGDPSVYCTFSYLQRYLEEDGYGVEHVPGITSFTAAAARLGIPLTEWDEPLRVLPAVHSGTEELQQKGTLVLMKSASRMKEVKDLLRNAGKDVSCVINCGMENEQICRSLDEIPDDAGYFSLLIAKDK